MQGVAPPRPRLADRLRTILVPTDFSPAAGHARRCAEQIATQIQAQIVLLHVFDDADYLVGAAVGLQATPPQLEAYRSAVYREAEEELRAVAASLRRGGFGVEAVISEGPSACRITQAAAEYHADLVVIATHGRTGGRAGAMGAVTEQVARYAPCPVLVVQPPQQLSPLGPGVRGMAAPPLGLHHLLVATDFSPSAQLAVEVGGEIALEATAEMTLLHVMLPQEYAVGRPDFGPHGTGVETLYENIRDAAAKVVEDACVSWEAAGVRAEPLVLRGLAADRIVEAARAAGVGLIVLAAQGTSAWNLALLGSTAQRVLHAAPCSVLIVRPPVDRKVAEEPPA
ncbi:MAG: universal stress protein [Verrucomicrobia bacterium]|nr:universal stress protein [Verrucomicrobiota bacterium]